MTSPPDSHAAAWRDPSVAVADRVALLMAEMTLEEKVAQLYGVWVGADSSGGGVAPHQHDMAGLPVAWEELIRSGLGQLTRPFGTAPVAPEMGARGVAATQRDIVSSSRLGIPALVHEECLTGLAAWQATVFPAPLSWGASFDPVLVERMGAAIGATMASLGVHQGLAPVLDVTRDLRWGRVEETIGEDPHLVGTIGSAYVRGVESAGVIATLKHFVGYSASRGGRNLAPVSAGARELADVLLPPFEMALRSGARSVMNSYSDIDGVPVAADATLLTDLLRGTYGFDGTVVADYFSVAFLETLHGVAGDRADAARQALHAGIDVELPTVACFGEPLLKAVESGEVDLALVDRALERVLRQKCELGLLDAGWDPTPPVLQAGGPVELDPASSRALAREVAERAVVLLANDGTLPLAPQAKVALVGPQAGATHGFMGCYSFPLHVGAQHPDVEMGLQVDTLVDALRALGDHEVVHAQGCPVLGGDDEDIAAAVRVAAEADVCVLALGDLAGLFGRGTSGEGCDVSDLSLPGRQGELLEAVLATGTPVVLLLMVGRPYDISPYVDRLAAVVCGFFLGEEGGPVLADVLTGRLDAQGRARGRTGGVPLEGTEPQEVLVDGDARPGQRLAVALLAQLRRHEVGTPGDHADPRVPELQQVLDAGAGALEVAAAERRHPRATGVRVDRHDGAVVVDVRHGRRDQDGAVEQRAHDPGQVAALPPHVLVDAAAGRVGDQLEAAAADGVGGALEHLDAERLEVRDEHADHVRP
jgi:beta-glucosidase